MFSPGLRRGRTNTLLILLERTPFERQKIQTHRTEKKVNVYILNNVHELSSGGTEKRSRNYIFYLYTDLS